MGQAPRTSLSSLGELYHTALGNRPCRWVLSFHIKMWKSTPARCTYHRRERSEPGLNPRKFECFTRPSWLITCLLFVSVTKIQTSVTHDGIFPLPSSCSNRDWDSTVPLSTQFTRRVFTSCNYLQVLFPYNDIIQVFHLVQILQLSQYLPLSLCVLV